MSEQRTFITHRELDERLRAVAPAAFLLPSHLLRRVIKKERRLGGVSLQVPHRKCHTLPGSALQALLPFQEELDRGALGALLAQDPAQRVCIVEAPTAERFAEDEAEILLGRTWRLLFHAQVHLSLEEALAADRLNESSIRARIRRLGRVTFQEIHTVLREEGFLLPPLDDVHIYIEFAALFLELRHFAPGLLAHYFPTLDSLEAIDELLAIDLDAAQLLKSTRLEGASLPEPPVSADLIRDFDDLELASDDALFEAANTAFAQGNAVRAVFSYRRVESFAPKDSAEREAAAQEATDVLDALGARIAFTLGGGETPDWREAIAPLADRPRAITSPEARLLFDLQRACIDHDRDIRKIDLADWLFSFGRRPLQRSLKTQRKVRPLRFLRKARHLLPKVRLTPPQRARLEAILRQTIKVHEEVFREQLEEPLWGVLEEIGLKPRNLPEHVAFQKLSAELLDRVIEHGFINMGDLRDAVARNHLKIANLSGPSEWFSGDPILAANARLREVFDGVYRPGEIYLRAMQKSSSLFFGTRSGRLLTLWVILPLLSAGIILEGSQHAAGPLFNWLFGIHVHLLSLWSFAGLSLFLVALIHSPSFRALTFKAAKTGWKATTWLFGLPFQLLRLPFIVSLRESPPYLLARDFVFIPALSSALLCSPLLLTSLSTSTRALIAGLVALLFSVFLNTSFGELLHEQILDEAARGWRRTLHRLIPGLIRSILSFFRQLFENIDHKLYRVDEWLRFKQGEAKASVALKAAFGFVWFFFTYFTRFCINLLIEPQINPIKHFPVVTVSHKVMLSTIPLTSKLFGEGAAAAISTGTPGIFGFLAWELKENWRIYEQNRPEDLGPVTIGSHGESMGQLLKPGFHSGTLPKVHAKLRRAKRKALITGRDRVLRKHKEALHHTEEALQRFVERTLLSSLQEHPGWTHMLELESLRLASHHIRWNLNSAGDASLQVDVFERSGWIVAEVQGQGWGDRLSPRERLVLHSALVGFFKLSGVQLIHTQIEAALPPDSIYDLTPDALLVWPDPEAPECLLVPLRDKTAVAPEDTSLPTRKQLRFDEEALSWSAWVQFWEDQESGEDVEKGLFSEWLILPSLV